MYRLNPSQTLKWETTRSKKEQDAPCENDYAAVDIVMEKLL